MGKRDEETGAMTRILFEEGVLGKLSEVIPLASADQALRALKLRLSCAIAR